MAGLSLVLEEPHEQNHPPPEKAQIVSKTSLHHRCTNKKLTVSSFLQRCFLCLKELANDRDIYMYRGDRAFCSVECRRRQIFMDEQDAGGGIISGSAPRAPAPCAVATSRISQSEQQQKDAV